MEMEMGTVRGIPIAISILHSLVRLFSRLENLPRAKRSEARGGGPRAQGQRRDEEKDEPANTEWKWKWERSAAFRLPFPFFIRWFVFSPASRTSPVRSEAKNVGEATHAQPARASSRKADP